MAFGRLFVGLVSVLLLSSFSWGFQFSKELEIAYAPLQERTGLSLEQFYNIERPNFEVRKLTVNQWVDLFVNFTINGKAESNLKRAVVDCSSPTAQPGDDCNDGNACTLSDRCLYSADGESLTCTGSTVVSNYCDLGNKCNSYTCNPSVGCQTTVVTTCPADSNLCTTESCNPATGQCRSVNSVTCAQDSNLCTTESCNPVNGQCQSTPTTVASNCVADSNLCTNEACNPDNGKCESTPTTVATECVADLDLCNTEACNPDNGKCESTPTTVATECVADSDLCNTEACNPDNGKCESTTSVTCNDNSLCTTDSCVPATGLCSYVTISCDDSNSCTTDSCVAATGCSNTPKTNFYCNNGVSNPVINRCEVVPVDTVGANPPICNGHPCLKDDKPGLPTNYNEGFCNCYSGWSGQQCETKEIETDDKLPPVDTVNGNFKTGEPVIDPQDEIGDIPALGVTFSIPSSQSPLHNPDNLGSLEKLTRLAFMPPPPASTTGVKRSGDLMIKRADPVNPNGCNYPNNPRWILDTVNDGGWTDTYSNKFGYAELAGCGLSFVKQDENYAYFGTTVRIERDYTISNGRFSFERTYFVDQEISIEFPRHLSVSTNVVVSNNTVEFYAAVTSIHFNPADQVWDITISTAVNKPFYKLELAATVSNPHPSSPIRDWEEVQINGDCVSDYSGGCKQEWKYRTSSCDALDIEALTMNFKVVCISGDTPNTPAQGECATPNVDQDQPQAIIQIKTARACPYSEQFKILGSTLTSYEDNTYTTPKELFGISEEMYLAVDFPPPPAGIASIKIIALCAYPRIEDDEDVPSSCPDDKKVDPDNVDSETAANYAGHKFAFHTKAGFLKAASGVEEDQNKLTIQAELEIEYDESISKRSSSTTRYYTLTKDISINGNKLTVQAGEAVAEKSSASAVSFMLTLLILTIAALL